MKKDIVNKTIKLLEDENIYYDDVTLKESPNFKLIGSKEIEDGHTFYYLSIKPKTNLKFAADVYVRGKQGIISDIEIGTPSFGAISLEDAQEYINTLSEEVSFANEILEGELDYKDQIDKLSK